MFLIKAHVETQYFFARLYDNGKQLYFLRRFPDLFILPANWISCLVRPSRLSVLSFTPKILQCLHCGGNKMFPSFAILNSQYIIIWIVTNLSKPSSFPSFSPSAVFFFLDRAAGCIVSSQCLASPRVQTFFGNYKQPSQPREAFVDSFPVCINIYQARKQRQMSTMRRFLRVARWWARSCSGLKRNPSIRFVVLKHFVQMCTVFGCCRTGEVLDGCRISVIQ